MSWIVLTFCAAFAQAWRNAWQKTLSHSVDALGVTLARFLFAAPLAALYLFAMQCYYSLGLPQISHTFIVMVVLAALSQIVATALMVLLFQRQNYAIGVGLAKSEAILAALLAVIFLHESFSFGAWLGVALGGLAVFLLSGVRARRLPDKRTLVIGLACGLSFACTSLLVREASQQLPTLPYLLRAAWVLCSVLWIQILGLLLWLGWRQPQTLSTMRQHKKTVLAISVAGFCASVGWFSAMSMQSVALVKTLGQVEVWFTLLISARLFRESLSYADRWGLALIVAGAVLVIWG
ncbi:DMT family transporter [Suttonella sp. R2A3]|uniref:DMT family transporter n=1 Tax=Suttonella sp. R2A3 TaxID=2908648 RepID=UPI001F48FC12|nr:DMT family transporter [Suttonella sp. R2A3]UJF23818.1 DMT family transporter [Suttonella sp. R2A3]